MSEREPVSSVLGTTPTLSAADLVREKLLDKLDEQEIVKLILFFFRFLNFVLNLLFIPYFYSLIYVFIVY